MVCKLKTVTLLVASVCLCKGKLQIGRLIDELPNKQIICSLAVASLEGLGPKTRSQIGKFLSSQSGHTAPQVLGFPPTQKIIIIYVIRLYLAGGFNPSENISQIGSFPQVGVKIKKYLKPPPRYTLVP